MNGNSEIERPAIAILEDEREDRLALAKIMGAHGADLPAIKRVAEWVFEDDELVDIRLAVVAITYPRALGWAAALDLAEWIANG